MKNVRRTSFVVLSAIMLCVAALSYFDRRTLPTISEGVEGVAVPVLMYHQVLDLPSKLGAYVVSPGELEADLKLLSERGYETVTVKDLIAYCKGERRLPSKPVMLTFDDGYMTDYATVFPLLKRYNMKAVFSVVGSYTERYSQNIDKHINYAHLSWEQIKEMSDSGLCEFQNHSYDMHSLNPRHGCLKVNGENDSEYQMLMADDVAHAQKLFAENLGFAPECFTYPYGAADDALRKIISEVGFYATMGTYEKINFFTGDISELYDIKRFNRYHGRNVAKILDDAERAK